MKEWKEYWQILPAAELIMKNESVKRSLCHNKAQSMSSGPFRRKEPAERSKGKSKQKGRSGEAGKEVLTDFPNNGGHYEKEKLQTEPLPQQASEGESSQEKGGSIDGSSQQRRSL